MKMKLILLPLLLFAMSCHTLKYESPNFSDLSVEMQSNPKGVSMLNPRFSWQIVGNKPDIRQTAYQIEVAGTKGKLDKESQLLWNSGRIASDQSQLIAYAGLPLESDKDYYWRVTVWTNSGDKIQSDINDWSMSLRNDKDWKASWIGLNDTTSLRLNGDRTILPARYLRKEFELSQTPKRAVLYVSGVGSSVCYVNGERVGNDVFGPLPTWYDASVPYLTYDVTELLRKGTNAIGVILGNGRFLSMRANSMIGFGLPRLMAQMNVTYENGKTDTVVSDASWMATNNGPITENNEFDGEKYNASLELGDWAQKDYDDSLWAKAEMMEAPKGKFVAQLSPSLKVMEEIQPISIKSAGDGKYIVDMGQNMVGFLQIRLRGKKNSPITMRFAEVLKDNGTALYLDNLRGALVTDIYTPAHDGDFVWEPTFVYHGFQYVELSGLDYEPSVSDFTGKVIYDQMKTTGTFESSDTLLNKLFKNAYWGIRGNYRGMPTDCPQRDERLGWLGDRTTGAFGESFILDNALMYKKWLVDIEESMNENGSISDVSPRYWTLHHDDVTWPAAYFYIADMLYQQFGDDYSIKNRYPTMKRWVNHMRNTQLKDYILVRDVYGDWCMPPESPELIHSEDPSRKTNGEVLSSAVFYSILQLMEKFAFMNGIPEDAAEYAQLASRMKAAYNKNFFDYDTAQYDNNTVTANLLSLRFGLVPEGYEAKVFSNIVSKTKVDCNSHVSVGVIGIQHLMRGLTERGELELAYQIATNETYPSWGYMINKGATTIWELWNGDTANPAMNSRNHVMLLGDLLIWLYEDIAGIQNDPASVGFKKIIMEPSFPDKLSFVNASHKTPYGLVESNWKRSGNQLTWNVVIPPNSTATLRLPLNFNIKVGLKQKGVLTAKEVDDKLVIELGSGKYLFSSK